MERNIKNARKLLSKYESRTSILVSSNVEYMDVLLITIVCI